MPRPPKWKKILLSAIDEAVLAVSIYNDPNIPRAVEGFIVHMHMAWLYLLQAKYTRDGINFHHRDGNGKLIKVDGEPKCFELAECLSVEWADQNNPVRRNIEFFIGLRNKLEHRHLTSDSNLIIAVGGKSQSNLLNFEKAVNESFGTDFSLAHRIRFPVFIGTFTTEGEQSLRDLRDSVPADLRTFIAQYDAGLPDETRDSAQFELRLQVILQKSNRGQDALPMRFFHIDDMSPEEHEAAELLGRMGQTIIQERVRPVFNAGLVRPGEVVRQVAEAIPFRFTQHDHGGAWRTIGIRPRQGDPHPERTNQDFCLYDELSGSYGYKPSWIRKLIEDCSTAEGFQITVGHPARPRPVAEEEGDEDV